MIVAALAPLGIALATAVAGLISGSSALLSEAAHSVADTVTEVPLLTALERGEKPADEDHPLGPGVERRLRALLGAVATFVGGAVFSPYDGVRILAGARSPCAGRRAQSLAVSGLFALDDAMDTEGATTVTDETWNPRGARIRGAFLDALPLVVDLLAEPAVAAAWHDPSALRDFPVRGLAGHTFWQELALPGLLAAPLPAEPVIPLREYYLDRVIWLDAGADGDVSVRIRRGGEATAADGHAALLARVREAAGLLAAEVPGLPAVRPLHIPSWGDWSLELDDFLLTRLLELVVHADDLAVSVGLPTPAFPEHVTAPAIELLARLAVRRHGTTGVIRGLARAERAPESIAGI